MAIEISLQDLNCSLTADYTNTEVPVTIEFDTETSILNPGPGELQKFCYIVTQVSAPKGLSHFVLVICPEITEEDLGEVTVFINGEEQTVEIGENVEIFTPPDTDPTTGCPGLKFDFGLSNTGDVMNVCFELKTIHQIGSIGTCIKGGQFVGNDQTVCGPICGIIEPCDTTVFQNVDVCVPITITPETITGPINVRCCNAAVVSSEPCPPSGPSSCVFYVRQRLCAEVPISFSATGESGNPIVTCQEPNQTGCTDCPGTNSF